MTRYKKQDPEMTRRKFVNVAMGATATVGVVSLVSALGTANPVFRLTREKMPPLKGDILVHAAGPKEGQPVALADLSEKLVRAWPMGTSEEGKPLIRKGNPNNILVVYRFPKGQLVAPTKLEGTIDGEVVVYTDICTHAGCSVADDDQKLGAMKCPCHSGQYDPKQGCKVIGGPPPRGLAQLPVRMDGDKIVAAGFFYSEPQPFGYNSPEAWEAFTKVVEGQLA